MNTSTPPPLDGVSAEPLVTIAIPTYNRADRLLPMALQSVCRQTYAKLDILVADNASTDATAEVVRAFADDRIRYTRHTENKGSAWNTNFCIQHSRGEYTLLLNDDDLIDPDFVATCVAAIPAGARPGLIRTGTRIIDRDATVLRVHANHVTGTEFEDFIADWAGCRIVPYLCSTLFLTAPLQAVGLHSRHYLWDDVLTELRILAEHGRIDVPTIHASFREHPGEITFNVDPRKWIEDSRQLLDVAIGLCRKDPRATRARLAPFLARLDYDRAAKTPAPLWRRLGVGLYAWRQLGVPPDLRWLRTTLSEEAWYRTLKSSRWVRWIKRGRSTTGAAEGSRR